MATLTRRQIAAAMVAAGFPENTPGVIDTGVAIVLAESGGITDRVSPTNSNGTRDYGLWQINSSHRELWNRTFTESWESGGWKNPANNTHFAYLLYRGRGNNWADWSAFNSGAYRAHLKETNLKGIGEDTTSLTPIGLVAGPEADQAWKEKIDAVDDKLGSALSFVRDGAVTAGIFLLAVILLILGVWFIISQTKAGKTVGKVADLVPAAKAVKAVS